MSLPVILVIIAVLGLAGYVGFLFVMRLPMSETGYVVGYVVSVGVAMTVAVWVAHYIVYEVTMWLALPIIAAALVVGCFIDRHKYKQGTLELDPESRFDLWFAKVILRVPTEDLQKQASELHIRPDPPE